MERIVLDGEGFEKEILGWCGPTVVVCGSPWTGSTHIVRGIIDGIAQEFCPAVKFVFMDSLQCPCLLKQYSLGDVALFFFRDGKLVDQRRGIVSGDEVRTCIAALLVHGNPCGGKEL